MEATIEYEIAYGPSNICKQDAWVIWQKVRPGFGIDVISKDIAVFNMDSEARNFIAHIVAAGLDGKLIHVPRDMKEDLLQLKRYDDERKKR